MKKGDDLVSPLPKGYGVFYRLPRVHKLWFGYFTTQVKLHGQWGPRLETSVHSGWISLPDYSS
jgi:hypothetical protein